LTDKSKYIKYYTGVLTQINDALGKFYGQSGEWSANTKRYSEAINKISQLEGLMAIPGQMTEGEYQRSATLILTGLGISPDVSKIPTTQVNVARAARDRQQEIEKTNNALARSENLRLISQGNPNVAKANDFLIASEVFNTITNSNSSSLNTTISKLEYYIKEQPDLAQARNYPAQLSLLTKYRTEQEKVTTLQANAHKLEGDIASLGFKINPPNLLQYVQPANTPLGATQGTSPRAEVQQLPIGQTIPGASTAELDAKKRELQSTYDQITNYATFWADNGINIFNPKDTQYIRKMEVESQAARDLIKKTPEYGQTRVSSAPSPSETGGLTPDSPESTKLFKSLEFEATRNGYFDVTKKALDGDTFDKYMKETLARPEALKQIDVLNTKYESALNYLIKAYDGGNTTDPEELRNTLVYDKTGLNTEQIRGLDTLMGIQQGSIQKLDKLLQSKSQWYRQKLGTPQASNPPTNFSQGNAPKPASQTALPQQTQPLSPVVPAAGNLVKTPFGFAPFKGGKVTFTSDFQGSQRFGNSKRPDHNGIDMQNLTDKRVATVQGGTVVFAKMGSNGDYGNTVVVKAADGTYELFGHLSSITVKEGDVVNPATHIGNTGTSGNATGDIVHFGVSTSLNPKTLTATQWMNPIEYLQKVGVKTTVPRGQGAAPDGSSTTTGNTGFYKISNNLTYMNGYVLDRSSGMVRKATQTEQANVSSFTPIQTITRTSNNQPTQSNYQAPSGETITENWVIPKQAVADKDFIFVHPTGRTASNGNTILAIEAYRNGKKVFSVEALSGEGGVSTNRHQPGIRAMLPDGTYNVARDTKPGANAKVGDLFLPLTYNGTTGRADIGIHWDADGDRTTAGCLATLTKADRDKIYSFVQGSGKALRLYVNTMNVNRTVSRASAINTPNGNSSGSPVQQTSTQRSSYPGSNKPTDSYGYRALKDHPDWASALADGANKIGVPAVWLADMIDTESSWINQRGSSDGLSAGIFQPTEETLRWLGRATIGRSMTKAEFVDKGVAWQLREALPAYLRIIGKEVGKGYKSAGDVVAAIWGGGRGLRMSPNERMTQLGTRGENWTQKMRRVGKSVGRSYSPQASLPAITHDNPRDTCATCNQMLLNGNFTAHTIKTDQLIPNDYA
jgi:murein DD-endopeptidase MepM/ murein hydrolase activator NlpD